jgi:hypothetical protein
MWCKNVALNSLIYRDFRPVFDQKLEMGCSRKENEIRARTIFDDS